MGGAGGPFGYDRDEVAYIMQMEREKRELIDQLRKEQQRMVWKNQMAAQIQTPPWSNSALGGLSGAGLQSGQISLNSLQRQISTAQDLTTTYVKTLSDKIRQLDASQPVKIPDPGPPMPDYIGTLTGWRGWRVSSDGKLLALGATQVWEPRKAEPATCISSKDHQSPVKDCKCGYWTFRTRDLLLEAALAAYASSVKVIGTVELWGRVIECKNGWRAQFAYPKELWLLESGLESLSWQYGVPVRQLNHMKYPATPDDCRP